MKLDRDKTHTVEGVRGGKITTSVEVLQLSAEQINHMGLGSGVSPDLYVLQRNNEGFVHSLTPIQLETSTEWAQFMNEKTKFEASVLKKLRG